MTSPSQQKLRVVDPTVVTANRLSDGKVLYRAADEGWTTRLEAAAVVTTTEAARELLAAAVREDTEAVDAYAAPVAICDGCIEPGNLRERIRAAGRHSRCQQRGNHPKKLTRALYSTNFPSRLPHNARPPPPPDRNPVRHALLGAAAHLRAHREEI